MMTGRVINLDADTDTLILIRETSSPPYVLNVYIHISVARTPAAGFLCNDRNLPDFAEGIT